MINAKTLLLSLTSFLVFVACAQQENKSNTETVEPADKAIEVAEKRHHEPHPYGGWYCPDNLNGFPPVDIQELDKIPVVEGRLPSEEEARNGMSLIYVDTEKYLNARALDIDLPQLATIYSEHSDMEELVIIIQAIVIDEDTIVGYRFPNGGNGSAWIDQVSFLNPDDVAGFGSRPFVFEKANIEATTQDIWGAFTETVYARQLGERFNKEAFFASEWTNHSMARLEYKTLGEKAKGIVANVFGSLYLQIDYDLNGFHFAEKFLILEDDASGTSEVLLVSGPYRENFETYQRDWQTWLAELTAESEAQ
jgi:hypothetical protein